MARPITLKINVTRILKEHLYAGKSGKYLDMVAWPNKDGPDQYGNTHMVCQSVSKEAREQGIKGPIVGNLTLPEDEAPRQTARPEPRPNAARPATSAADGMEDDDIPF